MPPALVPVILTAYEYRMQAHVYPYLGRIPVADVTELDVETALAKATQAAEKKLVRAVAKMWTIVQPSVRRRRSNPTGVG